MSKLIVIGMHRSGTSCLAGTILTRYGLDFGELNPKEATNPKGNQENPIIKNLNESILDYNGGSWCELPDSLVCPDIHRDFAVDVIETVDGFKDPRATLLTQFWASVCPAQFIGTFRHPYSVADSLVARDASKGIDRKKALELWIKYNRELLESFSPLVCYDWDTITYHSAVDKIMSYYGYEKKSDEQFRSEDLFRQKRYNVHELDGELYLIYSKLLERANG